MPTIFKSGDFRFFLFSNKGSPSDPEHIFVRRGRHVVQFWLKPAIVLADVDENFAAWELADIEQIIRKNKDFIDGSDKDVNVYDPLAEKVWFSSGMMWVELTDKRVLGTPITHFPRLMHASEADLANYEISGNGTGIHWDAIDEDISVLALMLGVCDLDAGRFLS